MFYWWNSIQYILNSIPRLVTLSSTCQHQSSPWKIIWTDYFRGFSSFMKLMWSCYEDFTARTLPKLRHRVLREKRHSCPLILFIGWVLSLRDWDDCSEMITQMFSFLCNNRVWKCKCLRWNQACRGESRGYKQSSFSLSEKWQTTRTAL